MVEVVVTMVATTRGFKYLLLLIASYRIMICFQACLFASYCILRAFVLRQVTVTLDENITVFMKTSLIYAS